MDLKLLGPHALGSSAAQAYASHTARALGVAKFYADSNPLESVSGEAGENNTAILLAHLHAATADGKPSRNQPVIDALRRLNKGHGEVGTGRDYDVPLRNLMTIAYRYGTQIGGDGVDYILNDLTPDHMAGGHPPDLDVVTDVPIVLEYPETENHLLMIESSRFLVNQMRGRDNNENGLAGWLLSYMGVIARHDFLEFSSIPYARYSLHALLNLYEFARDIHVITAAQILLDYTFMKCAISSTRGRRVAPFRRQQHRITHQANATDDLWSDRSDEVAGYFRAYTGQIGPTGKPVHLPAARLMHALFAGTSTYRPPVAAYELALGADIPRSLHYLYHGMRPSLPESGTVADAGIEIYYRALSFLISAGGQFLSSGYGRDEVDIQLEPTEDIKLDLKNAWEQTSRAQATTLIPLRADVAFHDLIRLEPWPDPAVDPHADHRDNPACYHTKAVNMGVHRGIMAGANLRPSDKKIIRENTSSQGPSLAALDDQLFVGWKGAGNDALNVARVLVTEVLMDGVEGITHKTVLNETSDHAPALAALNNSLFVAWKGSGNDNINLAFSDDRGASFKGKQVLDQLTEFAPALADHLGRLYLAWTGTNEHLNVAEIAAGDFGIGGIEQHVVLDHTSEAGPAMVSIGGRLFLAWKGSGNDALNLIHSDDYGASFKGWVALPEESSDGPSLAVRDDDLFISWKGSGNEQLNVARVFMTFGTDGAIQSQTLTNKVVLGETSDHAPAIIGFKKNLYLSWTGESNEYLNFRVSKDATFQSSSPWIFRNLKKLGFYVAAYRTPPGNPQHLEPAALDNLAIVYAMETKGTDYENNFDAFCRNMKKRNDHLPARLDYGGMYRFKTILDGEFSVWFMQTTEKYRERIADVDAPIGDFTTLPLVSGEYMRAPGGHDGLIEIRHPAFMSAPLLLDFRVAASPKRLEDIPGCSGPWIERVKALVEQLSYFVAKGKSADAARAATEAGILHEFLLGRSEGVFGPSLAAPIADALTLLNVDATVPSWSLLTMLATPSQSSVPALAQALLLVGRRLKRALAIDQIFAFYKVHEGGDAHHMLSDVRNEVLLDCLLRAHLERYGETLSDSSNLFMEQ